MRFFLGKRGSETLDLGLPAAPKTEGDLSKVYFQSWFIVKWVFPKIGGKPPKWMVYFLENPIKMDDLGGKTHYFWKHPNGVIYIER